MLAALPDLGALAAAALLLLIAAALWVLIRLIDGSLGKAPLIGGWITREIGGWLNDARNAILRAASASWGAAVKLFDWSIALERVVFGSVLRFALEVSFTIDHIVRTWGPRLLHLAIGQAVHYYRLAEADLRNGERILRTALDTAIRTAEAIALREYRVVRGYAFELVRGAELEARSLVRAAELTAANALARASTTLHRDIAAAEAAAAAATRAVEVTLSKDVGMLQRETATAVRAAEVLAAVRLAAVRKGIYTDLTTWGDLAVSEVWPEVDGDIQALRRVLGNDFPWLRDLTGALGGLGAAGLLGSLIRSMAGAEAITKLATDCIVPNCRNLSQFGEDLQNLLGIAGDAAMLAWVIFMITDPSGWAADMERFAVQPAAATIADAAHLFGVA